MQNIFIQKLVLNKKNKLSNSFYNSCTSYPQCDVNIKKISIN